MAFYDLCVSLWVYSVTQLCPTLCDPMDCSLPGYSIHEISQARIPEQVAISYSRDLPDTGIKPTSLGSPALADGFFTTAPPGKLPVMIWPLPTFPPSSPPVHLEFQTHRLSPSSPNLPGPHNFIPWLFSWKSWFIFKRKNLERCYQHPEEQKLEQDNLFPLKIAKHFKRLRISRG